ncbi:MAG: putative metal-binding motif-containing protein [Polyangiaceae bacterium]|nr:putative metal-binding motif-containing protein [Polyangiaceae bacterium]
MALAAAALPLLAARTASAETIPAGSTVTLGGDRVDDVYDIAGTILVPAYNPNVSNTGYLHLRANTITVQTTGVVSATGAGFGYTVSSGGQGVGTTPAPTAANEPGGGGSHTGLGGTGFQFAAGQPCIPFPAGPGLVYDATALAPAALVAPLTGLGSAGGGSNTVNNPAVQPGGAGGGVIILEAAVVVIDGQVRAEGRSPAPVLGTGAGGGAGGTIVIRSNGLTLGAAATISARGAAGAIGNSLGGAGGGGRVLLQAQNEPTLLDRVEASGGDPIGAPNQSGCTSTGGSAGLEELDPLPGCLDVDGDGHGSSQCAGDDCDDSDPAVSPDANEICNDIDDDCNGSTDDQLSGAPRLCAEGSVCQAGACVPVGDGGPPPVDAAVGEAPELALRGGLCSSGLPGATAAGRGLIAFGALGLAIAGATALRRRRRR